MMAGIKFLSSIASEHMQHRNCAVVIWPAGSPDLPSIADSILFHRSCTPNFHNAQIRIAAISPHLVFIYAYHASDDAT
jgi:hypothetical protein